MGLDLRWFAKVLLVVGGPAAVFAIVLSVLDGFTHPIKFLSDHDLAQVVLLVTVAAALALVNILAHGFLLETRRPKGRTWLAVCSVMITHKRRRAKS
jgi:hypothetical protein